MLLLELLILLTLANGSPVVASKLLGARLSWPIDAGRSWADGNPVLGPSKTWRGMLSAVILTSLGAFLLGLGAWQGAVFGAVAMVGDLCSSFTKRRLGLTASAKATGLDQVPESLLPLLIGMLLWDYGWHIVVLGVVIFFLLVVLLSPFLYFLGIRRRPY